MRWSLFGNLSKMDLSKIKIGWTISFCFKASKRPLLSSIRKSRLCQKRAVIFLDLSDLLAVIFYEVIFGFPKFDT